MPIATAAVTAAARTAVPVSAGANPGVSGKTDGRGAATTAAGTITASARRVRALACSASRRSVAATASHSCSSDDAAVALAAARPLLAPDPERSGAAIGRSFLRTPRSTSVARKRFSIAVRPPPEPVRPRSGTTRAGWRRADHSKARIAFITGASSGLGRAAAIELAQAGADIAPFARSDAELARLAAVLRREDVRTLPLPIDLADADAVLAAAEDAITEFGRVDLLVNGAATDVPGEIEHLTVQDWDRVLAVTLRARRSSSARPSFHTCIKPAGGRS